MFEISIHFWYIFKHEEEEMCDVCGELHSIVNCPELGFKSVSTATSRFERET